MLRVSFETGRCGQNLRFLESGCANDSCKRRLAVRQRSRFVENKSTTRVDLLEDGRSLDDDAPPGGKRESSTDRNGYANEQWTRSRDHDHREEALDFATDCPGDKGNADRQWRVPRSQHVPEPAQLRSSLLS